MNEEQENEILAISSIYIDTFKEIVDDEDDNFEGESKSYQVIITPNISCLKETDSDYGLIIDTDHDYNIYFKFSYPKGYPESEAPHISIKASWLQISDQSILSSHLENFWNPGELIIFQMISWIQENSVQTLLDHYKLNKKSSSSQYHKNQKTNQQKQQQLQLQQQQQQQQNENNKPINNRKVPTIYTGPAVTEKKSKFQAHLAIVKDEEDVRLVLDHLLSYKKIYEATHNMYTYRIELPNGEIDEYCNDDGEDGAGEKMLFTLNKNQSKNVLVVVTRWFGGILLGGRRYFHIVNVTKEILDIQSSNSLNQCSLEYNK
ncbi:hypothetical protein DICPUDRAFT_33913 [Dictyostelium purpureum]|uniref:RWD domain-containing protein n=1 Tax=Dictyostelium purpureum TaxID=5786 RepID=F0ZLS0_DICPU|nr:uncharacterized protein DICPUDRAFT_33913 [Dictyostelium purpureum]EGC35105.1 hypothetical protein DICPUDRAFT_33913 [Dictyostelium purpureum]|eukprot:XP_003288357.1 hypothetical protein DICPUDRAFT_33913 [Dictyostelium purpureum]